MIRTRHYLLAILFASLTAVQVHALPKQSPVPGGVVIVGINSNPQVTPKAFFNKQPIAVIKNTDPAGLPWLAIVGVPLDTTPDSYFLEIKTPLHQEIPVVIKAKKYATQYIKLKSDSKVTPSAADQKRIDKESKILQQALRHWSDKSPFDEKFIVPVRGKITSTFGLNRYYNQVRGKPHTGIDIAAAKGTAIRAPAAGVVLIIGDFFYTGKTVIIDHGSGLISLYAHLDTVDVKKGQYVVQGKLIGTVGETGRATGPHLHWAVALNETFIDPMLFVDKKIFH